ncbi:MAG: hypothetical protein ABEK50_07520 [bacterium]
MRQTLVTNRLSMTSFLTLVLVTLLVGCQEQPVLLPRALPDATAGESYEVNLHLRGQNSPLNSFRLVEGGLPEGLRLRPDTENPALEAGQNRTIQIVGVPKVAGTFNFTLAVSTFGTQKHGISLRQTFDLKVFAGPVER